MKKLLLLVFFAIVLNSCNGGYEVPQEIITRDSIAFHTKFPEAANVENISQPQSTNSRYSIEKIGWGEGFKDDYYMSVLTFEGKRFLLLQSFRNTTAIPLD